MPSPAVNLLLRSPDWTRPNFPARLPRLAAWYDASDLASMVVDGSNRVSLWADKSGNPRANQLILPGVSGNYASIPNQAYPAAEIEVVVRLTAANYASGAEQIVVAKDDLATNRCFKFSIKDVGNLLLGVSATGAALTTATSSAAVGMAAGTTNWIKGTWRASDGRVQFFTAPDSAAEPPAWTQLGTDQTAAVASIFNGNQVTEFGSGTTGTTALLIGHLLYVGLRSTIGGNLFASVDFTAPAKLSTSFVCGTGQTVTVSATSIYNAARICGPWDLYQGVVANQPVLTIAPTGNFLTFDGTNDGLLSSPNNVTTIPQMWYLVCSQITWTDTDRLFGAGSTVSRGISQGGVTPQIKLRNASVVLSANSGLPLNTRGLITGTCNGATSYLRVNRLAPVGPDDMGASLALSGIQVATNGSNSVPSNAAFSEIVVYAAGHGIETQNRFALYAGRKWRVAV